MHVSSDTRRLVELLGARRGVDGSAFEVRHAWRRAFLARGPGETLAFLVPLEVTTQQVGRIFGSLALRFDHVKFDVGGTVWDAHAAILECSTDELLPTFVALTVDAAARLNEGIPTTRRVIEVLAQWEALFRAAHALTRAEEIGLWGELSVILRASDTDHAVRAWCGPLGSNIDFEGRSCGLECKAGFERHAHHFSLSQVGRPRGDHPAYVVSMWVGHDQGAGSSVPELVDRIAERLEDPGEFEQKLLAAGYSRADARLYVRRFVCLEAPKVFPASCIPTVRMLDPGVRDVRFTAELDVERALAPETAQALLENLGLDESEPRAPIGSEAP